MLNKGYPQAALYTAVLQRNAPVGFAQTTRRSSPQSHGKPLPAACKGSSFLKISFALEILLQKTHIRLWLPVRVGEEFFVDTSHVSQHALLCLGQSPQCNFLLSQAAGFLIPNPKWVVSSTPGIFQRQLETQPSPQGV